MSASLSAAPQKALPQDYQDILQVLPHLPEADMPAAHAALAGMADMSPAGRAMRGWLARWQGKARPRLEHPRLSVFVANHAVARLLPPVVTAAAQVAAMADPAGTLAGVVGAVDADFRLYEMNLAQPAADCTQQAALSLATCVQAIAYGMMTVDQGLDVLALAACGDGQDVAAAIMLAALLERPMPDVLKQMGLPAALAEELTPVVERVKGLAPCVVLEQCGGTAIAALVGAMLAARMAHTPVVIADWGGFAALAVVQRLDDGFAARHVTLAGKIAQVPWLPDSVRIADITDSDIGMAALGALQTLRQVV